MDQDQSNEALLEQASETLDLANRYAEEFVGTTAGDVLVELIKHATQNIDDNDLESLFNSSLPALNRIVDECGRVLAQESQEAFYGTGDEF